MFRKIFHIRERGSSVRTEILGGLTTFMTMAYIVFLNPAILSGGLSGTETGLSVDAAMAATCIAAAAATILMGLYANFPIAQAPGMGENIFFVSVATALAAQGVTNAWQVTLGIVFISGILFLILSLLRFRKAVVDSVSPSMKNAIAVGIGLLIALIGLRNAGVVLAVPGSGLAFNQKILSPDVLLFFAGLIFTAALHARRIRGAILWGVLFTALASLAAGQIRFTGVIGLPKENAFFKMDVVSALEFRFLPFILVFLFMDLFDTVGTIIGVSEQAGFIKDNQIPGSNRVFVSDAVGTVVGACSGTSTVTSFIESAVGVEYGARTGLSSVVTGILFLAALFFSPLAGMIGKYGPVTAPALLIVGSMMARNIAKIDWQDYTESIPAFLVIIGIPVSNNIADGLALGFIVYPVIKVLAGRHRDVYWMVYIVAALFFLRYTLIWI